LAPAVANKVLALADLVSSGSTICPLALGCFLFPGQPIRSSFVLLFPNRFELKDEWRLENLKAFANISSDIVFGDCAIPSYMLQPEKSEFPSEKLTHLIVCALHI
jgi:hypothetical protein